MQNVVDSLPVLVFVLGALLERTAPARDYPPVSRWRLTGLLFFVAGATIAISTGALLAWGLGEVRLVDTSVLGPAQVPVALLVLTFVQYWMHRAYHASDFLFRWVHQVHHSAERIDVWTSFFAHPSDMVLQSVAIGLVSTLLGLDALAAGALVGASFFINVIQHLNVRTPRWLGFLVQRPESHNIHHQRGVHAFNYGDLAIWDLAFGTYRNPEGPIAVEVGYWRGGSQQIAAMLLGRDVTSPPPAPTAQLDAARV